MTKQTGLKVKPLSLPERNAYRRLEDVVGCKWSAAVVAAIGRGVTRPGQLERFIPGISTKVLNERLRKLLDYGVVTRQEFPGKVLRVATARLTMDSPFARFSCRHETLMRHSFCLLPA